MKVFSLNMLQVVLQHTIVVKSLYVELCGIVLSLTFFLSFNSFVSFEELYYLIHALRLSHHIIRGLGTHLFMFFI